MPLFFFIRSTTEIVPLVTGTGWAIEVWFLEVARILCSSPRLHGLLGLLLPIGSQVVSRPEISRAEADLHVGYRPRLSLMLGHETAWSFGLYTTSSEPG